MNITNQIKSDLAIHSAAIANVAETLDKQLKELKEKEEVLTCWEKKMEEHAAKAKNKIVLDVGGKRFATSKSTLLTFTNSYFWAMLSSGKWLPDDDGREINLTTYFEGVTLLIGIQNILIASWTT